MPILPVVVLKLTKGALANEVVAGLLLHCVRVTVAMKRLYYIRDQKSRNLFEGVLKNPKVVRVGELRRVS